MPVAREREDRDQATVAPSHDPDPPGIDVRQVLHHPVVRGEHVVDVEPAVVDRIVVLRAEPGAPPVLRRDHDIAALDRLAHEGPRRMAPVSVHSAVHPDRRRVPVRATPVERLKQVGRNGQVPHPAPVRDPPEVHHALGDRVVDAVDTRLLPRVPGVVGDRVVLPAVADVQVAGPDRVHGHVGSGAVGPVPGGLLAREAGWPERDQEAEPEQAPECVRRPARSTGGGSDHVPIPRLRRASGGANDLRRVIYRGHPLR